MFALGSKVVSKSHGIPGVVEEVKKYGGYQFLVVKVSGTHFVEGALLTKVYGKSYEFDAQ